MLDPVIAGTLLSLVLNFALLAASYRWYRAYRTERRRHQTCHRVMEQQIVRNAVDRSRLRSDSPA